MTPAQVSSGVIRMEESLAANRSPVCIRTQDRIVSDKL